VLDLGELLSIPYVETEMGFDISPDGKRVAFAWNPGGTWEIYEKDLSSDSAPRLISRGPGGKFHPRYSPDGTRLAYAVDMDGSERFHIFLFDFRSADQIDLTPNPQGSLQASFDWSPDGSKLALISDRAGQFNVYLLSIETESGNIHEPELFFDGGYPVWKVRWSPDGEMMAVVVEAAGIDYGTFIVPIKGGDVWRISIEAGPIDAGQACWSPDSASLAFTSDVDGYNNVGIANIATHKIRWLTEGAGEKQFPCWSPDGSTIAYIHNRGTVSWLAMQKTAGSPILRQIEPGVHYLPDFSPDGKSILMGFDSPCHPGDLWSYSLETEKFFQVTKSLPDKYACFDFIMPEEVTYPGMDGTPIPALLYRTGLGDGSGSAVLVIHGGPDWLFEMTWYPVMAALADRGWTVLAPNYRGSTGYGREWQEASRYDFGGLDTDDVAAGALFLIRDGLADAKKIGITGRSHGGYLTASCMTRYPDLWAVGSAVVPFLNWFANHDDIRPDLQKWDLENFGDPVKDHDLWVERSPAFFMDKVQAPLQLICGRNDARCPIRDSIEASEMLRRLGKTVELIIFEDEGHSFLKKENLVDSEMRRLAFLDRYLEVKKD
jgi:dipeptidyl aminopeptidase/acylaminoacyl peptidase